MKSFITFFHICPDFLSLEEESQLTMETGYWKHIGKYSTNIRRVRKRGRGGTVCRSITISRGEKELIEV